MSGKLVRMGNKDVLDALSASVQELQKGIDTHCTLLASLKGKPVDRHNLESLFELCPSRERERQLKNAVKEAIGVIEETRRAFKSKKLEALRKKLTQVLIDLN